MKQAQRSALTALLVLAAGAFLVALAIHVRTTREGQEREAESARRPLDIDVDDIEEMHLRRGDSTLSLRRDAESWFVTSPVQDQADALVVARLLQGLEMLRAARRFEAGAMPDPSQVGLQPPQIELELRAGERRAVIQVGSVNSFNRQVYVRAGSDAASAAMFMTGASFRGDLMQDLFALRDKRLARCRALDVTRLVVVPAASLRAQAYQLEQEAAGHWVLRLPPGVEVDQDLAARLRDQLCATRYLRVVEEKASELTRYQLEPPLVAISLREGETERQLRLGSVIEGEPDKRYALRAGDDNVVVAVDASLLLRLTPTLTELRDKRVLPLDPATVERLKFPLDDGRLVVVERQRADGGSDTWAVLAPRACQADTGRVAVFLRTLTRLEGVREEDVQGSDGPSAEQLRRHGLDAPVHAISLFNAEDVELATLLVGPERGSERMVWRRGANRLQAIAGRALDAWPRLLDDLLEEAGDAGRFP
ncbi:MAG: DUF4340 domain-containing protein [Pseudomonadota bacterium]